MSALPPLTPAARKRARWPLYLPFALMFGALAACAVAWLIEREQVSRALDAAPAQAAAQGVALTLGERTVSGFPLRLRVRFASAKVAGGAGWAAEASGLVAQAYVFAPRHWVVVAPAGLTVTRPQAGSLAVGGQALRASLVGLGAADWRLAFEGSGLGFAAGPGGRPFMLQSARRLELDAKPARPGGTALLLQVDGGVATPEGALWHVASGSPFDLALSGRLAPGAFKLERVEARGGPTAVSSTGGVLQVGADGRLVGALPLRIRQAPAAPAATPGTPAAVAIERARRQGEDATLNLVFADGQARLGPFKLGPSPKVAP